METITGTWNSEKYNDIFGTFEITVPSNYKDSFLTTLILKYDQNSQFRGAQEKSIELKGMFTQDNGEKRYIFRSLKLAIDQMFMLTFTTHKDLPGWHGFYSCIKPYDIGRLYNCHLGL